MNCCTLYALSALPDSYMDFNFWHPRTLPIGQMPFAIKSIPESPNKSDTSFGLLCTQCRWITNAKCACAWHSKADGSPSLHMEHLGYLLGLGPVLTSLFLHGNEWQILSRCLRHTACWGQCFVTKVCNVYIGHALLFHVCISKQCTRMHAS